VNGPVHAPVLYTQVIAALAVRPDGCYIDCTLGGGGHSLAIIEASRPHGRLLGLDRDPHALATASKRLWAYGERVVLIHCSFAELGSVARQTQFTQVDGILFDLGLSSLQLADPMRGFSIQNDGPLDMRFDPSQELSAADIVNHWSETEIADLIFRYGEEPRSRAIARAIVRRRPLHSTAELAAAAAGAVQRHGRLHAATRTFQALRIAVNDELAMLGEALPQALELLRSDGRLTVISFHSLEDRIVKNFIREQQQSERLKNLTRKPLTATQEEIKANPRSRSAKLRVACRL
jgi:16S rRNA (cytosine1402-N4)-methyltransferase